MNPLKLMKYMMLGMLQFGIGIAFMAGAAEGAPPDSSAYTLFVLFPVFILFLTMSWLALMNCGKFVKELAGLS